MKKKRWLMNRALNKKGDVWVSAVLYFGLGIVVLTLVLSLGMPAVNRLRDKNVATQTKDVFATVDANIREVARGGPGTQRVLELGLSKGEVKVYSAANPEKVNDYKGTDIDTAKKVIFGESLKDIPNRVVWTYQLKAALSEPGLLVTEGNTKMLTTGSKGSYNVRFWLDYEPSIYLRMEGANIISGNTKITMKNMGSQCINLKDKTKPGDYSPKGGTIGMFNYEGKCTQDPVGSGLLMISYPDPRITILIQPAQ